MGSSWCILILKKDKKGLCCTGVAPATKPPMPKLERVAQIRKIMLNRCKGYPVCVLTFSPPGLLFIYTHLCARVGAPLFIRWDINGDIHSFFVTLRRWTNGELSFQRQEGE